MPGIRIKPIIELIIDSPNSDGTIDKRAYNNTTWFADMHYHATYQSAFYCPTAFGAMLQPDVKLKDTKLDDWDITTTPSVGLNYDEIKNIGSAQEKKSILFGGCNTSFKIYMLSKSKVAYTQPFAIYLYFFGKVKTIKALWGSNGPGICYDGANNYVYAISFYGTQISAGASALGYTAKANEYIFWFTPTPGGIAITTNFTNNAFWLPTGYEWKLNPDQQQYSIKIELETAGAVAVSVWTAKFPKFGYVLPYINLPTQPDINTNFTYSIIAATPEGTKAYWVSSGLAGLPCIKLEADDKQLATPVIYGVTVNSTTTLTPGTPNPINLTDRIQEIEASFADDLRNNTIRLKLRNFDAALNIRGNEKATLRAGWLIEDPQTHEQTIENGELVNMQLKPPLIFTSYISNPDYTRKADDKGRSYLQFTLKDRTFRLNKKFAADLPFYDGWKHTDAIKDILKRIGVQEADMLITTDDFKLPTGQWHFESYDSAGQPTWRYQPLIQFRLGTTIPECLDEITKFTSWIWYWDKNGKFVYSPRPADETVSFIIDETATEDIIQYAEISRDMEVIRNVTLVIGQDYLTGYPIAGFYKDQDSITNPAADNYIGDDWWQIIIDPAYCITQTCEFIARYLGDRSAKVYKLIRWITEFKPTLKLFDVVELQVDGLGVPRGTKFRIKNFHYLINSDETTCKQTFEGEVI